MKIKNIVSKLVLVVTFVIIGSCTSTRDKNFWKLKSTNENISVSIKLQSDSTLSNLAEQFGKIFYKVDFLDKDTQSVIKYSQLGIESNEQSFSDSLKFLSSHKRTFVEKYSLLHGKKSNIKSEGNELLLKFENPSGRKININFKIFDDGVSFRYEFPESEKNELTIINELSSFSLPKNSRCTIQPYPQVSKWTPAYEAPYLVDTSLSKMISDDYEFSFPALFNIRNNKVWLLLTESNLNKNYCGSHLKLNENKSIFKIKFPKKGEGNSIGGVYPKTKLPFNTPWRVMIIGNSLSKIVESTLVTDLSEPNKLKDVSWIKPGKASWSWWSDNDSPQNPNALRKFIDLSSFMGWEYSLIDANWNKMNRDTIISIVEYSKRKNVDLIFWYNSGGKHNIIEEEPRDRMMKENRSKEFEWLANIGVKGVKVDFFQSDKQNMIKHYIGILEDAAKYKIMVNFHGCTIPRGWSRTYPNMMTLESVLGAENYIFNKSYSEVAPILNTVLPFTRNVIGPMDYTPVTFSNNKFPHKTSMAHELALSIIFESGWQHFADRVNAYNSLSTDVKQLLKEIPSTWDDVKYISGEPGEDVILARRRNDDWYIAGINGENKIKNNIISLLFLNDGTYKANIFNDDDGENKIVTSQNTFSNSDSLDIEMKDFGGFLIQMIKE
ncbi:MAG: glycoside hydrolase family 97 catalytic domain-containing protein [Melioribacteraceae bacterium]